MAAMTTALTEFSNNGDSITWTTSGHTASKPKLVLQKRKVPSGSQIVSETTIQVVHATEDDAGEVLPQKVAFEAKVRHPVNGQVADVTAVLAIFRDIVAGDEFGNMVTTQEPLK
jgi:hypothetical protein